MSEETERRLEEARARASQAGAQVEGRKREFLDTIASDIPARIEKLAKGTAHAQPDVSKALGKDGLRKLRDELRDQAMELATEVCGSTDKIKWPKPQSEFSSVSSRHLHSALFDFLYPRCRSLAAIFKRYGFNVHDDNAQHAQGLVTPQSHLYSETEQAAQFTALAEALNVLAEQERALAKAQVAYDRDVVDSLWEDD
ncbi:hypothetical protein ABZ671_25330 [Micromonospora sp. NPDC006766]|uniref:hypothetical protein n=1 Tax=Micromonospora sp. NPDC006766 TaxID=3154778 RepID=UPI0033BFEB22